MPQLLFHIGKGGVGKSTISALTAVSAASTGTNTLLLSLDPAHNLSDIFAVQIDDADSRLCPHLWAREVDVQGWMRRYLLDLEMEMRRNYTYLTALNLDRHFRLLRHAPGMEEFALALAFRTIVESHAELDLIICDMPPTALALRFFAAPSIALSWTEELLSLRRSMLEKKRIATKIRFGKAEFERDRVLKKLEENAQRHRREQLLFRDVTRSRLRIVLNADQLSGREALRIHEELALLGIHSEMLIVNKTTEASPDLPAPLDGLPVHHVPSCTAPLHGMDAITTFSPVMLPVLPGRY